MTAKPIRIKQRIAVLYGGKSGEHDVSLMSAASVMEHLDDSEFDITPVLIRKDGSWELPPDQMREFDCVFPVLHGPNGEDGTVQGLLQTLGVPYVGAGVIGSALGMDKVVFKDVMRAHKLPVVNFIVVRRAAWQTITAEDRALLFARIANELGFPCFVKPANMGSSVGISKVRNAGDLSAAFNEAFRWDRKVLVEWGVPKARELEVAVLGNETKRASRVGEIVPRREFYDYQAKYFEQGDAATELVVPAVIPAALEALIQETAIEVATLAEADGMARVDFLIDGTNNEIFVSEINTIPGFTSMSMYPRMFAASGLSYEALLTELITLAHEAHSSQSSK